MKRIRGWLLGCFLVFLTALGSTAALAQGTYSLEFQAINGGGETASSASYQADQELILVGTSPVTAQSSNYEVTTLLDLPQPPAVVQVWMLY